MTINPNIFQAYDIRGKYPAELDERVMERIGYATATYLSRTRRKVRGRFIVCRDVRNSSKSLRDAVVRGVIAQGSDVIDVGVGTSPYFSFIMRQRVADGGVMITASHNPPEYNGLKIRDFRGESVYLGRGLEKIRTLAGRSWKAGRVLGSVAIETRYRDEYIAFFSRRFLVRDPLRIAIDAAGGSTALFLPDILSRFPAIEYTPLFFEIDGSFRGHPPNPLLPDAAAPIREELRGGKYRFGALFDGDGDRIVFFDEKARPIDPQFVFLALAREAIAHARGRRLTFVLPVDASRVLREELIRLGSRVKRVRRGYVFLQGPMRTYSSPMSVERSGHFFFEDFSFDDSGIFALLTFASLAAKSGIPVSRITEPPKPFATTGELNFPVEDRARALRRARAYLSRLPGVRVNSIDGITAEFPEWWCTIRPSNTEPVMRLVMEADTEELIREKLMAIEKILRS